MLALYTIHGRQGVTETETTTPAMWIIVCGWLLLYCSQQLTRRVYPAILGYLLLSLTRSAGDNGEGVAKITL